MKIKSKLIYNLFKIFPKKFIKLFNKFYSHKLSYNLLNLVEKGVKIDVIYDIGAFRGEWSNFLNKTSLKDKEFFLFEANEENKEYLKKLNFKYFIEVLSDKEKNVEFYSQASTGDSYFIEQTNVYKNDCKPKLKKTNTIDNVIKNNNLPLPNLIKIDTQGSELDILKGSKESIFNCSLIYLECPIIEYNLQSPNLNNYIEYLNSIDFIPYDICETHKIDNILIQIDILFIKKSIFHKIHPEKKILNILNSN
jgi:FkbM family methyltransferase